MNWPSCVEGTYNSPSARCKREIYIWIPTGLRCRYVHGLSDDIVKVVIRVPVRIRQMHHVCLYFTKLEKTFEVWRLRKRDYGRQSIPSEENWDIIVSKLLRENLILLYTNSEISRLEMNRTLVAPPAVSYKVLLFPPGLNNHYETYLEKSAKSVFQRSDLV